MYPQLHIPDGFLSPQISLLLWVATAVLIGIAVRKTSRTDVRLIASQPILMGVLGAFIFAAQMFNFPVATGTSGHLLGGVLAGYLLGPWAGTIVMATVIGIQALLFQDGGLLVLGANIFNMGVIGTLGGSFVARGASTALGGSRSASIIGAGAAAWLAVVAAAGFTTLQLGLSGTKVKVSDRGFVEVDGYCRTGEPNVYAVGDLIATPQLAHVAYAEAIVAVKHMRGEKVYPVMYDRVPWAIYCHPEVAWAGPSEEEARAAGHDVVVAKHQFRANSRAMILGEPDGLVKIIAKKDRDGRAGQVLGVHMVGPWVTEQLSGGYLAVNWEATVDEIAEFIQPHPSLTELFGETVLSLTGRSINA